MDYVKDLPVFRHTRYYGPDDGKPRHDWCRSDHCISCGCVRERPCDSHTEARGYRDWFAHLNSDVSEASTRG